MRYSENFVWNNVYLAVCYGLFGMLMFGKLEQT